MLRPPLSLCASREDIPLPRLVKRKGHAASLSISWVVWRTPSFRLPCRYGRAPGDPDAGQWIQASSARDLPSAVLPADAAVLERGSEWAAHLRGPLRAAGVLLWDQLHFLWPSPERGEMNPHSRSWGTGTSQHGWRRGGCEIRLTSHVDVIRGCWGILVHFHPRAGTQRHLKFLLLTSVLQD